MTTHLISPFDTDASMCGLSPSYHMGDFVKDANLVDCESCIKKLPLIDLINAPDGNTFLTLMETVFPKYRQSQYWADRTLIYSASKAESGDVEGAIRAVASEIERRYKMSGISAALNQAMLAKPDGHDTSTLHDACGNRYD